MRSVISRNLLIAVLGAGTAGLAGCVIAPYHHHPYYYSSRGAVVVSHAPPPPRVEVVGMAPFVGAVWLPGRWIWHDDDSWRWRDGYWAKPPHHGARWQRGEWQRRGERWHWQPGRWHDRD